MRSKIWIIYNLSAAYAILFLFLTSFFEAQAAVRINEIVASNSKSLTDQNGNAEDWIELFNNSDETVDLGGCYLTDKKTSPTQWQFPSPTLLEPYSFLIVFADSSTELPVSGSELHANFNLSKSGEYLGLIDRDGQTPIHEINFPAQYNDISYGIEQSKVNLIDNQSQFKWSIPSSSGYSVSGTGTGNVGFTANDSQQNNFNISYYEFNTAVNNLDEAENYITNPSTWKNSSYPYITQSSTINYSASNPGHFDSDNPFPTHSNTSQDKDNFVVIAETSILIPFAGLWTFGVSSDDGFSLDISGQGAHFSTEYTSARSMSDTFACFNFPTPGSYSLRLLFFEASGGSGLELFAARGNYAEFNNEMALVGDVANGGISTETAFASSIITDLSESMLGINSRVDLSYAFTLEESMLPTGNDTLSLSLRYADGFILLLNGNELLRQNAPENLSWNSTSTVSRSLNEILSWEKFILPKESLLIGENTLQIIALNNSADDSEFLFQPELNLIYNTQENLRFFTQPTPEQVNGSGYLGRTLPVEFSHERGYCQEPFTLELISYEPDTEVYYTLDGSEPSTENGTLYTEPLIINQTTILRAISYRPEYIPSEISSRTWIFLDDVFQQSSTPPTGWPASYAINSHAMYYGMNSSIVNSPDYVERLREGFGDICTLSLITDLDNLFDPQSGIYVNPGNSGRSWERPVSIEYIDPQGGEEFQIDAGLRIRGAASRASNNPKHSFRLFFRGEYGQSSLVFPLFGEEGVSEFDKLDLRTEQNHSWHREDPSTYTAVREVFARDSQKAAGTPYTRSRYYHLFLNGIYWGIYMSQERVDSEFAVSYFGGNKEDWDCIKTESSSGRATVAGDGNLEAWEQFYNYCTQGFSGAYESNYYKVRGMNPDGTRNPDYPILLDEDNLIKFMINAYYMGDPDNPYSLFGYHPNNLFGLYNRVNPDGFKWFRHDAEHALAANRSSRPDWGLDMDYTTAGVDRTDYAGFTPIAMHLALVQNEQYKMRFADLVQEQLFNNGIFTPEQSIQRYQERMNQIDRAVIGESARWGAAMGTLRTRDNDWVNENNYVLKTYFPQRTDIVINQFRARGWFPEIDAPTPTLLAGIYEPGQEITLSSMDSFYYTTDGSDPRMPDGSINPNAILVTSEGIQTNGVTSQVLIPKFSAWNYYDKGQTPPDKNGVSWKTISYSDSDWDSGQGKFGFGSRTENLNTTTTRITDEGTFVITTYFRQRFNLSSLRGITGLKLSINRDDGAVIYLNGKELHRENMPQGTISFDTFSDTTVDASTDSIYFQYELPAEYLREGSNLIAVEVHQCNTISSDLYFDMELSTLVDSSIPPEGAASITLTLDENMALRTRSYNGEWSALCSMDYLVLQDYSSLRVSELMYAPIGNPEQPEISTDDFAWLELCNRGQKAINLQEVQFVEGIEYTFPSLVLQPGQYLVLAKNAEQFSTRYETNNILLLDGYSGNLAHKGETLTLQAPDGTLIHSFAYNRSWYPETDETNYTLEIIDLQAPDDSWNTSANWYPSSIPGGTPGFEAATLPGPGNQMLTQGEQAILILPQIEESPQNITWHYYSGSGKWETLFGETSPELTLQNASEQTVGLYMAQFDLNGQHFLTLPTEIMLLYSEPQDASGEEGTSITLSASAAALYPEKLQWQKQLPDGSWNDLPGAVGLSLCIERLSGSDDGFYRLRLDEQWFSRQARLEIQTESIPPEILSVDVLDNNTLRINWSEYVTEESALNPENYSIDNNAAILSISSEDVPLLGAINTTLLRIDRLQAGHIYTLTVNNIIDTSSNQNTILANTKEYIRIAPVTPSLLRQVWNGCSSLDALLSLSTYPDSPDETSSLSSFLSPIDCADNYSQRISGFIVPPISGNYFFWVCSDDSSQLFLSTDSNPENVRQIAYLDGWSSPYEWEKYPSQKSTAITLSANTPYYIEAIQAEADGGDHLMVQWSLPNGTLQSPIGEQYIYPPETTFEVPQIVVNPLSSAKSIGETAVFEIYAQSSTPLTYTWEIDGKLSEAPSSYTLTLTNLTLADNGKQIRCHVSNITGNAVSEIATLTVTPKMEPVTIITQPVGGVITDGESHLLSITASGTPPISYLWYKDGEPTRVTTAKWNISDPGKYKVQVSNPINSIFSDEVEVTIEDTPQELPSISIARDTDGTLIIEFTGRLQSSLSSDASEEEWSDLESTSPARIIPDGNTRFFRAISSSSR